MYGFAPMLFKTRWGGGAMRKAPPGKKGIPYIPLRCKILWNDGPIWGFPEMKACFTSMEIVSLRKCQPSRQPAAPAGRLVQKMLIYSSTRHFFALHICAKALPA